MPKTRQCTVVDAIFLVNRANSQPFASSRMYCAGGVTSVSQPDLTAMISSPVTTPPILGSAINPTANRQRFHAYFFAFIEVSAVNNLLPCDSYKHEHYIIVVRTI